MVDSYAKAQTPQNPFLRYLDSEIAEAEGDGNRNGGEGQQPPQQPIFDLDKIVTCWGDYLKAQFHPRSLIGIGGRSSTGDSYGTSEAAALNSGHADFSAFSYGSEFINDDIFDAARVQLEESDSIQGFQAFCDIDSGFGSFGLEYLSFIREECPRAPIVVLGAVQPHLRRLPGRIPGGLGLPDSQQAAGAHDFHERERENIRDVNLGLAFASFGSAASDLDCMFLPMSMQPYADVVEEAARSVAASMAAVVGESLAAEAVAHPSGHVAQALSAWFPGLRRLHAHKHYQTSAMLAAAWDSISMPFRRKAGYDGRILPVSRYQGEESEESGPSASRSMHTHVGLAEHSDARMKNGANTNGQQPDSHAWFDPALELSPDSAMVSLSAQLTMREFVGLMQPAPYLRTSSIAMTLPFPHPRASATLLQRVMNGMPALHEHSLDLLQPLSWTSGLPNSWYRSSNSSRGSGGARAGTTGSSAAAGGTSANPTSPASAAEEDPRYKAPFAHALVMRGVGSHAVDGTSAGSGGSAAASSVAGGARGGGYSSTTDAYGRVLDGVMARSKCRVAGHSTFRTPLPVPLTFPALFPPGLYDHAGAFVGSAAGLGHVRPPSSITQAQAMKHALHPSYSAYNPVQTPFSVPILAHLSCGPSYAPALTHIKDAFERRDRSVVHRFEAAARTAGGSSGMDMGEAMSALASMVDDYTIE